MLTTKDAYKEIEAVEKAMEADKDVFHKSVVKLLTLLLKATLNTRANIVQVMDHFKIEKVKPKQKTDEV